MSKIPLKIFNILWDEIRRREHKTDFGLAKAIGISNGTVSQWKSGKVKAVLPNVLSLIENELGYIIRLSDNNEWEVKKLNDAGVWKVGETTGAANANTEKPTERFDKREIELLAILKQHGVTDPNKLTRFLQRIETIKGLLCEDDDDHPLVTEHFTDSKKLSDKKNERGRIGFEKGNEIKF